MRCSLPLLTLLALGALAPAADSISAVQLKVGQVPGIDTNEKEA